VGLALGLWLYSGYEQVSSVPRKWKILSGLSDRAGDRRAAFDGDLFSADYVFARGVGTGRSGTPDISPKLRT